MRLSHFHSKTLRYLRLATATAAVILLNLSLYWFHHQTDSWIAFLTGILALLSALVNYLIYRILRDRPIAERYFTVEQSYIVFIVIAILCICFCCFEIVMMGEAIDRLVMLVLMLLLVVIAIGVSIKVSRWRGK